MDSKVSTLDYTSNSQSVAGDSAVGRGRLVGAALCLLFPVAIPAVMAAVIAVNYRRVRTGWFVVLTVIAAAIGMVFADGPLHWAVRGSSLWPSVVGHYLANSAAAQQRISSNPILQEWTTSTIAAAVGWQILLSLPIATTIGAVYSLMRAPDRRLLGTIEGAEYSNMRPVGILDRAIGRWWFAPRIRRGVYTVAPRGKADGQFALGLGRYRRPITSPLVRFKLPSLFLGQIRSGKTRLANSVAKQQVEVGGGGHLVIDFKAGPDIPRYWAQVAQEQGRHFLHFTFNDKSRNRYQAPHPYASESPAYYDPLVRGDGDSKSSMLLNSVDREGDADAYLRTAEDAVHLAFDLADLTGYSTGKGGLDTLAAMLEPRALEKAANDLTAEQVLAGGGASTLAEAQQRVQTIRTRVQAFDGTGPEARLMRGAISDTKTTISKYATSSALGGRLRPGSPDSTIDLVRAVLRGEIVVFSLAANDSPGMAALVATMVLLDLQNTVATLRNNNMDVAKLTGRSIASADATAWSPFGVQLEELGSIRSPAAATAILGLLNKSSNEGIRLFLSSQGWADFVAMDGTGVWADQALQSVANFFTFKIGDDEKIAAQSGKVTKRIARETISDTGFASMRLFQRARRIKARDVGAIERITEPRVPEGALQNLTSSDDGSVQEFVWISTKPAIAATHSVKEGPNSWYEPIRMVAVHEPRYNTDFFASPTDVDEARRLREEQRKRLFHDLTHDRTLAHVLRAASADHVDVDVAEMDAPTAVELSTSGEPATAPADRTEQSLARRPRRRAFTEPPVHARPREAVVDQLDSFFNDDDDDTSSQSQDAPYAGENTDGAAAFAHPPHGEEVEVENAPALLARVRPAHSKDLGDQQQFDATDL